MAPMSPKHPGPVDRLDTICRQRDLWLEVTAQHGQIDRVQVRSATTKKVIAGHHIENHPREIDAIAERLMQEIVTR
jgi:hypothetical protein